MLIISKRVSPHPPNSTDNSGHLDLKQKLEPSLESPTTADTNGTDSTSTSRMSRGSDPTPATKTYPTRP